MPKSIKNANPARGHKEVRRSTGHISNMDPNRDKALARSNQPRTSETYRRQDDFFGFTYLQSMDFQREPQSKHHLLYCEQEKSAHCHGSLLLRLGTHQIQNRTRDAHKISPHGTMTKRTPAMNWDHAVSWGGGLG